MAALPSGVHWDRILFCAKEATYKTWFPLTKRWLGFEDAHIIFGVDDSGSAGTFESTILIDGATLSGPPLSTLAGRWSVDRELVLMRVKINRDTRSEVMQICDIFRAKIVDVQHTNFLIEVSGNESKINKFIRLMQGFGISDLKRTGKVAMSRQQE